MDYNNDVRVIYLDQRSSDEDGMDIISISIDHSEGISLELQLEDAPVVDPSATYTIFLGKSKVIWSDGSARFHPEDDAPFDVGSEMDGDMIAVTIPGETFDDGIRGIFVQTLWEIDENTFIQDLLPDDPYSLSELLPFPTGYRRELDINVRSPENVIMKRVYSEFPLQGGEDIRSSIDTDDDGSVDGSEVEDFLHALETEILSSDHDEDLLMDNRKGDMDLSISHSGLIGPVDSGTDIMIEFILEFSFTISGSGEHEYDVDIAFFEPGITGSPRFDEDTNEYLVSIRIGSGWEIDPMTLEPPELSNYLTLNGTSIDYEMTGSDAREFDPGSVSFGIRASNPIGDDDDTGEEEDLTWLYVLILIIMLVIVAGLIFWYRRED
jgi:hypothetical protein